MEGFSPEANIFLRASDHTISEISSHAFIEVGFSYTGRLYSQDEGITEGFSKLKRLRRRLSVSFSEGVEVIPEDF